MFAKRACFLEHTDLNIAEPATGLVVGLDHSGQGDRASQSRRPTTDEENIHRDCFGIRCVGEDRRIERKRRLMYGRKTFTAAIGHWLLVGVCWSRAQTLVVLLRLAHRFGERRNYLEHIADDSVVRNFEDRRVLVLIDGDDRLRGAHACQMLYRSRDSDGDVKLGAHQPPGLSDLIAMGTPAIVRDGAGGTDCRVAKSGGEIFDELEILRCLEPASTGDNDGRLGQVEFSAPPLLRLDDSYASRIRVNSRL